MKSGKRLGKTLEDISHLFLSSSDPPVSENSESGSRPERNLVGNPGTRIWMSLSLVQEVPSAFFAANFSVEIARRGRRLLVIDTAPEPSLNEVLGTTPIQPSLNQLLEQSHKQLTIEGPLGMKILGFRFSQEEVREYAVEEQEILSQVLLREEEAAELILVHARYREDFAFTRVLEMVQGVILTVSPSHQNVLEVYRVCKYLYHVCPELRLGMVLYGTSNGENPGAWREKLTRAVDRFLGKSLEWFGAVPADPAVERSLQLRFPIVLLDTASKTARGFAAVTDRIQRKSGKTLDPIGRGLSFFHRGQPMDARVKSQ